MNEQPAVDPEQPAVDPEQEAADAERKLDETKAFEIAAQAANGARPSEQPVPKSKSGQKSTKIPMETNQDREIAAFIGKIRTLEQRLALRLMIAVFAICAVSFQLVAATLLFWGYLAWPEWRAGTPPQVVLGWLSATVVEIIGIVVIIANNLFPSSGSSSKPARRSDVAKILKVLDRDDASR